MPGVVPADRLPLATTLDSFAWSLMGAIGASLGGLAVRLTPLHHVTLLMTACSWYQSAFASLEEAPASSRRLPISNSNAFIGPRTGLVLLCCKAMVGCHAGITCGCQPLLHHRCSDLCGCCLVCLLAEGRHSCSGLYSCLISDLQQHSFAAQTLHSDFAMQCDSS